MNEVFNAWGAHCLVTVEQSMYMHRDGLLPDASWRAFENFGLPIISSPGGSACRAAYKGVIGQEFVRALDDTAAREESGRPTIYDIDPHWRL